MSFDLSEKELRRIVAEHFQDELLEYRRFPQGVENANYYVKTATRELVLRIYLKRDQQEIDFELSVLARLQECSFVPHQATEQIIVAGKPAVFFNYIAGKLLSSQTITVAVLEKLMAHLRQVHEQLLSFTPLGEKKRLTITDLSFLDWPCDDEILALIRQEKAYLYEKVLPKQLQMSIIHDDLSPENIVLRGDEVSIIDFDDAHRAPVVSDVATAIKSFVIDIVGIDVEKINTIMRSYGVLSQEECGLLYYLLKRRTVFMLLYMMQLPKDHLHREKLIKRELRSLHVLRECSEEEFGRMIGFANSSY